jgi:hypothetical protein
MCISNQTKVPFERKPFRFVITRNDGDVYLVRYNLFQCRWFTVKFHKILKSDDACLHDHPWAFMSLILWGGYVEHVEDEKGRKTSKIYHPLNLLLRKAKHRHRLEIHQPCYTLVITLNRVRQWGFWTRSGWVEWFKYNQGSNECN